MSAHAARRRGRGGIIAAAASAVAVLVGLGMVGTALAEQSDGPVEPPLTRTTASASPTSSPTSSPTTSPLPAPSVPGPTDASSGEPTETSAADPTHIPKSDVLPEDAVAPTGVPGITRIPAPTPTQTTPTETPDPVVAEPTRLRIPSIGVESDLLHLGLNDDGSLEVPPRGGPDNDKAAWYDGSPRPGQIGPAVLEGHIDSKQGPSVFYRLGELTKGDKVLVDRADGSTATFVVDKAERYPKDDFPTGKVYGSTPDSEIRLITCGGDFDHSTGHYVDNTVVYGHLVG